MSDKANIRVISNNPNDYGVYLYTYWNGAELPRDLQNALLKRDRWDDGQYLGRIIFCEMIKDCSDAIGYGISSYLEGGSRRILIVNPDTQTVQVKDKIWTFTEYIELSPEELGSIW